jgi:hypothetical protein
MFENASVTWYMGDNTSGVNDSVDSNNNSWLISNQLDLWDHDYTNVSTTDTFFDTYFSTSRFVVETVLAVLALCMNCMALISSAHARNKRYSIYHILFINLCVCNAMSLSLSWISNNTLFLFSDSLARMVEQGDGLCKVNTKTTIKHEKDFRL